MAGIYIHIPFCTEKCYYCDFYSGNQLYLIDEYVQALTRELIVRSDYLKSDTVNSIYFGGGTPSLLSERHISTILETISVNYSLKDNPEVTLECNPENITSAYVDEIFRSGINRISLGIQFLDDEILEKFNRKHSKELILNALNIINNSSFTNLSVDLIYAVPGITDDFLLDSLEQLLKFKIEHISAYSLTIAKNSQLFWKIKSGEFIENDEDTFLSQYKLVRDFLRFSGFEQYEVSNYARGGYYSLHNLSYWNQVPYLGVGVGSHSYNRISRRWNYTNIKRYIREAGNGNDSFAQEIEELTDIQIYNEFIILKLRTYSGISRSYIKEHFSKMILDHFDRNINKLLNSGHFERRDEIFYSLDEDIILADYLAKSLIL